MTRRHFVSLTVGGSLTNISATPSTSASLITSLAVRADGALYAASGDSVSKDGQAIFQSNWRCLSVAIVSKTQLLVAGGSPGRAGKVAMVSKTTKEQTLGNDLIYHVAAHPEGKVAAVACHDGQVFEIDLTSTETTLLGKHNGIARCVAYSPDGAHLISGGLDGALLAMARGSEEPPKRWQEHTAAVECVSIHPETKVVASGSRDARVRLHTLEGRLIRTYRGLGMEDEPVAGRLEARVLCLLWLGKRLLASTSNGGIYELSATDSHWKRLFQLNSGPIHALVVQKKELIIATNQIERHKLSK
jgi:WD40 repeat protein